MFLRLIDKIEGLMFDHQLDFLRSLLTPASSILIKLIRLLYIQYNNLMIIPQPGVRRKDGPRPRRPSHFELLDQVYIGILVHLSVLSVKCVNYMCNKV